ncbi:MAG: hypothetical protein ACI841_001789 [Planctomycetota bacterium]|jgi:hypothetical protein
MVTRYFEDTGEYLIEVLESADEKTVTGEVMAHGNIEYGVQSGKSMARPLFIGE